VCKYGIIDLERLKLPLGESGKTHGIVEKPDVDDAPSVQAVVGRYVLSGEI
jgi:UTP--glucose-1-phosphate uridylyltransferase